MGKLHMDSSLKGDFNGRKNWRKPCPTVTVIELLIERFHIDVHGINEGEKLSKRIFRYVPIGYQDIFQPTRMEKRRHIVHKFPPYERFIVGKGNTYRTFFLGNLKQGFWGNLMESVFLGTHLRDMPVLTEGATEIAPHTSYGENFPTGVKMIQGLLLHRVESHRGNLPIGEGVKRSTYVPSHTA
jgi:hypothetical protein